MLHVEATQKVYLSKMDQVSLFDFNLLLQIVNPHSERIELWSVQTWKDGFDVFVFVFFHFAFLNLCSFFKLYDVLWDLLRSHSCATILFLLCVLFAVHFLGRVTGSGYCSVLHLSAHAVIFKFTCLKHSAWIKLKILLQFLFGFFGEFYFLPKLA